VEVERLNKEILRQEGETIKQYKIRLFKNKEIYGLNTQDIADLINKETGDNFSESTYRKWFRNYIEGYEDAKKEVLSENDLIKEYELKKQELEKEKIKVRTEKLTLMQALREEARFELFIEHAVEAIRKTKPILINTNKITVLENNNKKSGLLIFADAHYGKELLIRGLHGEIINQYNIEIFEQRMWKLLSETINIIKKENFDKISVFNLGDEIEGILRISQLMSLKLGLVDSAIGFAYFIASWLNELSKYVYIDYYSTEGNHTDLRLITGKKGDLPEENISKIIQVLVSEIIKDNPNIKVHKNNTDKIFTNIQGFNILGIHGEEKNILQAIRDFSFIYNTSIDYLCTGHKHHTNSISAGIKRGCIGVGSIIGVDDYSMQLKKISSPSATFVVFEENKGKAIEYTINLD